MVGIIFIERKIVRDILIGASDGYSINELLPWVKSIQETDFSGDTWVILYRQNGDVRGRLEEMGINVYEVDHTPYLTKIEHGNYTLAHNIRFFHAWELLTRLNADGERYRYVIMTDISDVVFQKNPSDWLETRILREEYDYPTLIAPSEGISFEREEWNRDNMIRGFGQVLWELEAKNWQVYNVGTIAGMREPMENLFHTIFTITEGRYYPSDQSAFNVLLRGVFSRDWFHADSHSGWAAQCGVSLDPTKAWLWDRMNEPKPVIREDGKVVTDEGKEFVMVHQWGRVPELKKLYTEKYCE